MSDFYCCHCGGEDVDESVSCARCHCVVGECCRVDREDEAGQDVVLCPDCAAEEDEVD